MFVTYFDEVKSNPEQGMDQYFIGGICLPINAVDEIERKVHEIAIDVFGTSELTPDMEFHAKYI